MTQLKVYNFMGIRRLALGLSAMLLVISVISLATQGLRLGLDFTGGTQVEVGYQFCLLYTSPSPRDIGPSRMPSSA